MTREEMDAQVERMRGPRPCEGCGKPAEWGLCADCSRERERRQREREIRNRTWDLQRRLDTWDDARVSTPEYSARVRAPRLRALAARWAYSRGSVLVTGPTGVGKSTTLAALANRLLDEARAATDASHPIVAAVWTTAVELARSRRETRLGKADALLDSVMAAPLLFLDELGQEAADPRWLLEVVEARYPRRATLAASGLTRAALIERYGSGAVRKLVEPHGLDIDLFGEAEN